MKFRQRFDYLSIALTLLITAAAVAIGVIIYTTSSSSFLPAWITALLIGVILLVITSIPKSVVITPGALEIHCVLELTYIPIENIVSAKHVKFKTLIPVQLLGVCGFFGYYGYFFSLKQMKIVKVYTRSWRNLVEINTVDKKCYLISVQELDKFLLELDKQCELTSAKL